MFFAPKSAESAFEETPPPCPHWTNPLFSWLWMSFMDRSNYKWKLYRVYLLSSSSHDNLLDRNL